MTLSVAGRPIPHAAALSETCRLVLAFIDGGTPWLDWAVTSPSTHYNFADETALVSQVQHGLHAASLAWLPRPGLFVGPVKLMTLRQGELRALARAAGGDDSAPVTAQVRQVLREHDLRTNADLAGIAAWLARLGVGAAPLLQHLTLVDRLAIHALMTRLSPGADDDEAGIGAERALQAEAAAFGVRQARSPAEFCDYLRVYLDSTAHADLHAATPRERGRAALDVCQALLPQLFGALDGPVLAGLAAPAEVASAVADWGRRGRPLGFGRLSQALQQVLQSSDYAGETGLAARRVVASYLDAAQTFVATQRLARGLLGQDGTRMAFPVAGDGLQARLQLDAFGRLSLSEFGAAPATGRDEEPAVASATTSVLS